MIGDSRPITLKVHAKAGSATSSDAVSIGLIVTELVINALKHAFVPDKANGRIVVSYDIAATGWRLAVSDNGSGIAKGHGAAKPGLGTGIVEALGGQLDAEVKMSSGATGTQVTITHGTMPTDLTKAA